MTSSPITSYQKDGKTRETVTYFIFLDSKITADSDCCHEIKRHLLFGRKTMTNLDSILKSRDVTLPAKVQIVKTMVFPGACMDVRDGPQGLSAKKLMLLKCGVGEDLRFPWTAKWPNQSILKETNPEYPLEWLTLKLKLQYFGHLMCRTDSLEKTLLLEKIKVRR